MSAAVISTEHAAELDPARVAPPIVMANRVGHDSLFEHTKGGAPARVLPLIGNSHPTRWAPRPYVLDVTFDGGRRRVYADDHRDVAGVILGETYRALQAAATAAYDADPTEDTAQAVVDTDADLFAARAAHPRPPGRPCKPSGTKRSPTGRDSTSGTPGFCRSPPIRAPWHRVAT